MHTQKAGERLYFCRISFDPVYDRDGVKAAIDRTCEEHGVTGRVIYELLGVYDLLLRVWLPNNCGFDSFHRSLADELGRVGLSMLDPFEVDYMVRHWPFFKGDQQRTPEDPAIYRLQPQTIEMVERGEIEKLDSKQIAWLEDKELLARTDGSAGDPRDAKPGIKFMMIVSSSERLTQDEMEAFEGKIVDVLDGAVSLNQRSMYSGSGFGHFLLMGRADYDQDSFHAIQSQLIAPLNAADLRERFGTRTVTHLGGQRGYSVVEEKLSGEFAQAGVPQASSVHIAAGDKESLTVGSVYADRFEIRASLGDGGFADVFRAFDRYERVERALKVFRSSNPEVALREISALRNINHPNVVKLFWGDRHGPNWFMVCELIEGRALSQMKDVSPAKALAIVIQVLVALEAVHPADDRIAELRKKDEMRETELTELLQLEGSGLIHRDIKPENIMVGDDDRVVLVDFNIASPARDPTTTVSRTEAYFAPDGGLNYWDPADDLFACGVVLYQLLTGTHPYPDNRPIADLQPTDPRTYVPSMRPTLAAVLVKACSPLREHRYRMAKEMRVELERELRLLKTDTQTNRIARSITSRRESLGLTIEELSQATGVDRDRLAMIENSDTQPKLDELFSVSDRLEMTGELLEEFENLPTRDPDAGGPGKRKPPRGPRDPEQEDPDPEDPDRDRDDMDDDLPALDPV